MIRIKNINHKKKFGIFPVIFLGAIGSGLWEKVINPSMGKILKTILSILTLGRQSLRDSIYVRVARSIYDGKVDFFMFLLIILLLNIFFFILPFIVKSYLKITELTDTDEIPPFSKKIILLTAYTYKVFIIFLIFGSLFFLSKEEYISNSVNYYKQLSTVVAPYITSDEKIIYDSKFAQIENGNDFTQIITDLQKIATKYNLKYRNYDTF